MLNASFAQLDYYTEIDADELAYQVDGLSYLLDERIALYLFKAGEPIAFVLCIPDISPFVRRINGNLNLPNQLRLLLTRNRYRREAILVIKGTVPEEQGKDYMRLLNRELLRNLRAAGYRRGRGTFVETENVASSSQADRMGGEPLHGFTFYGARRWQPDLRSLRGLEPWFYRAPSRTTRSPGCSTTRRDRSSSASIRPATSPSATRPGAISSSASAPSSRRC